MKAILLYILSFIGVNAMGQIEDYMISSARESSLPFYGRLCESELSFVGINNPGLEETVYMSFDLSSSCEIDDAFAIYAYWQIRGNKLVAIHHGDYQIGNDYLVITDQNGKVLDSIIAMVSCDEYYVHPMQYKIQVDNSIVVRQAVITSVIDETLMHNGYTPKEFCTQYVDKMYTISNEGKFVLKNTTEHAIEKKTWKDFEGLNIIMDE